METADSLLKIQQEADRAAARVAELARERPLDAALYGLTVSVALLIDTIEELARELSSEERAAVNDATDATRSVLKAAQSATGHAGIA